MQRIGRHHVCQNLHFNTNFIFYNKRRSRQNMILNVGSTTSRQKGTRGEKTRVWKILVYIITEKRTPETQQRKFWLVIKDSGIYLIADGNVLRGVSNQLRQSAEDKFPLPPVVSHRLIIVSSDYLRHSHPPLSYISRARRRWSELIQGNTVRRKKEGRFPDREEEKEAREIADTTRRDILSRFLASDFSVRREKRDRHSRPISVHGGPTYG